MEHSVSTRIKLGIYAVVLLLSLSSCAGYQQKVTQEARDQISTMRVVSFVPQSEISVSINTSNVAAHSAHQAGAIGMLLGSIIDSAVNNSATKRAESRAERFRAVLEDRDFASELHTAFNDTADSIDWADAVFERRDGEKIGAVRKELLKNSKEDALLLLTSIYGLTPQLESFEIYTQFELYAKPNNDQGGSANSSPMKRVQFGRLKFQSDMIVPRIVLAGKEAVEEEKNRIREHYAAQIAKGGKSSRKAYTDIRNKQLRRVESKLSKKVGDDYVAEDGEALWLENNAQKLLDTMGEGVSEQSKLLAIELTDPYDDQYLDENLVGLPTMQIFPGGAFSGGKTRVQTGSDLGWLLSVEHGRKLWRLRNRALYSIAEDDVLRALTVSPQ